MDHPVAPASVWICCQWLETGGEQWHINDVASLKQPGSDFPRLRGTVSWFGTAQGKKVKARLWRAFDLQAVRTGLELLPPMHGSLSFLFPTDVALRPTQEK